MVSLLPQDFIAHTWHTVRAELARLVDCVTVDLEIVPGLLDTGQPEFRRVSNEKGDRYWLPWTAYLGAWISAEGQIVTLLISDRATLANVEGPLTTGLVSVITGACINLQGQVAIHANAVELGGWAIAFVGYSGMGKSTLSAYCTLQGAGFVTDDVLIVNQEGLVKQGLPRLKLYPEVGESLGLEVAHKTSYKFYYHPNQPNGELPQRSAPLGILYFLAESPDQTIYSQPVASGQAVFNLLSHSYYAADLIPESPDLLDSYVQVVAQTTVKQLFYPRNLSLLPQVYDLLMQEVCALGL